MKTVGKVAVCLLIVLPACAHRGDPLAMIRGCYQFTESDEGAALGLPWGIQLLADSLTGWTGQRDAFVARTWLTPIQVADHPFGYWKAVSADSVRTGYPAGGGFELVLGYGGKALSGWGRAVGDAIPAGSSNDPPLRRAVHAVRVSCPA